MPKDSAHMNSHAGIRFRAAMARAGNSSSGGVAIHRLFFGGALGVVEVESNIFLGSGTNLQCS
jgi:hypothetical protein